MFAIKISNETNSKIAVEIPEREYARLRVSFFLNRPVSWYLVSGYVNHLGQPIGWVMFPESAMKRYFQYNPDVIETDWDQIVRKEEEK